MLLDLIFDTFRIEYRERLVNGGPAIYPVGMGRGTNGAEAQAQLAEDTLVEDQLPNLVDCILRDFEGSLPEGLLAAWLNRALEVSLVALLQVGGELALAATFASRPRGFTRRELVPALRTVERHIRGRQRGDDPLSLGLRHLLDIAQRYESHDASPRAIAHASLLVARLAGRLEDEHRAMMSASRRSRDCSVLIEGLDDLLQCEGPGDPKKLRALEALSDEGVPSAIGTLGLLYATGQAVPVDPIRGAWLLAEAAALGDATACNHLAMQYALGADGFPANYRKATMFTQLCRDRGR